MIVMIRNNNKMLSRVTTKTGAYQNVMFI